MTYAKGFQSHMDQQETLGEVVKFVIGAVCAAIAGWLYGLINKVSKADFDKLSNEVAVIKAQAVINGTEMATLRVTLVALERRIDEGFRMLREDMHRDYKGDS